MSKFEDDIAQHMMNHMNEDHIDAMHDYCRMKSINTSDSSPRMVNIDFNGFDIQVGSQIHRFEFSKPCKTPKQAREALVELAKQARL